MLSVFYNVDSENIGPEPFRGGRKQNIVNCFKNTKHGKVAVNLNYYPHCKLHQSIGYALLSRTGSFTKINELG